MAIAALIYIITIFLLFKTQDGGRKHTPYVQYEPNIRDSWGSELSQIPSGGKAKVAYYL